MQVYIPTFKESKMPDDQNTSAPGAAPHESMADKIARIKSEEAAANPQGVGKGGPTSPSSPSAQAPGESGGQTKGADGTGQPKTLDSQAAADKLGDKTARVTDGTATGERVRATPTGHVPESNDVILGDQSSRKDGPKPQTVASQLKGDGSTSPHDATSDGGSRQGAAHDQVAGAAAKSDASKENPAFQAEAKARTI